MGNMEIWIGIVGVLGSLVAVCHNLQEKFDWLKGVWAVLAIITFAVCAFILVFLAQQFFFIVPDGEDLQTATDPIPAALPPQVEPEMEFAEREINFGETNDHCAGPRSVRWRVPANEGWAIDVASIKVQPRVVSSKSSYSGVIEATENEFYIEGRLANNGECVSVFGNTIARDGRGRLRVFGTYLETRPAVSDPSIQ